MSQYMVLCTGDNSVHIYIKDSKQVLLPPVAISLPYQSGFTFGIHV